MINTKFKFKIKEVARKHNLPESVVEEMFNSQYKFYKETMNKLPIKEIETEKEFNELKTTFYFKYIGKFFINWNRVKKIKEIVKNKELKEQNDGGED